MPGRSQAWRCNVCGYVHEGPEPPDVCPACGATPEEFEPVGAGDAAVAEPAAPPATACRIVVVGAGIAGVAAVESLLAKAPRAEITLVSQETELPYYRLNLTRYLAGEVKRESLVIHPTAWYAERGVRLLLGAEVCGLDLMGRSVGLRDGTRLPFDKLLLASGARPFVPPLPGADLQGVTSVRTIEDVDALRRTCTGGARCICIGGGILGLETAGALARHGAQVTLLESHGWLLPRQVNRRAGEILAERVRQLGITLRHRASTREIVGDDRARGVLLDEGTVLPADVVVVATGVRSNLALAQQAGLAVRHGVIVDNRLTTSHPEVLAAGDVAEHDGVVYGLWTASQAQGKVAGEVLAGGDAEFHGLPRSNTLKVLGVDLFSIGQIEPEGEDSLVVDQEADGCYRRFVFRGNRLVGAILLGDLGLMAAAKKAIEERRDCSSLVRNPTAEAIFARFEGANDGSGLAASRGGPSDAAGAGPAANPPGGASYACTVCGYVYDERRHGRAWSDLPADWVCPDCGAPKSSFQRVDPAPQGPPSPSRSRLVLAHRLFGYVFLAIFVALMWQMVPRLWSYQIEFPARTVVHMTLGMAVGVVLALKIAIVRFFRRLDAQLAPALGTSLLVGSVLLIGISAPAAFREAAATHRLFTEENRHRVQVLLAQAGSSEAECARWASHASLREGQQVLRQQCVECHDLRTVLARPRTPEAWRQTVNRMADRTTIFSPLDDQRQWQVTAYLVALSPQLQQSTQRLRDQQTRREATKQAAAAVSDSRETPAAYDSAPAKRLFDTKCAECHETTEVDKKPPPSEADARSLVARMVEEGMTATEGELAQIARYLADTYVKPKP